MAQNLLLEIGLEELPAHVVTPSMKQLQEKTAAFLDAHALPYTTIEAYSTPRRLAVARNPSTLGGRGRQIT